MGYIGEDRSLLINGSAPLAEKPVTEETAALRACLYQAQVIEGLSPMEAQARCAPGSGQYVEQVILPDFGTFWGGVADDFSGLPSTIGGAVGEVVQGATGTSVAGLLILAAVIGTLYLAAKVL